MNKIKLLMIEPTTLCNNNCYMCTHSERQTKKNMSLQTFQKILTRMPETKRVHIQGLGEPFINPEIGKMADYCKFKNIEKVTTTTNGTIVTKDIYKFDEVYISLPSVNDKTYEKITGRSISRTMFFIDNLDTSSRTKFVFTCVVTRDNAGEIDELKKFASDVGVPIAFTRVENWSSPIEGKPPDTSKVPGVLNVRTVDEKTQLNCTWCEDSFFVSVEGYICPCCIRMNPMVMQFGNILCTPFEEIYNSQLMNYWKRHRWFVCGNCASFSSLD